MSYTVKFSLEREIPKKKVEEFLANLNLENNHNNREIAIKVLGLQVYEEELKQGSLKTGDFKIKVSDGE